VRKSALDGTAEFRGCNVEAAARCTQKAVAISIEALMSPTCNMGTPVDKSGLNTLSGIFYKAALIGIK